MKGIAPPFASEAAMCAAFIAALPAEWTAYPETATWDILLVRRSDGCQIGIQAKLRLNAEVLCQAVRYDLSYSGEGPDYRAVLVPYGGHAELAALAPYCAVTVITMRAVRYYPYQPSLPSLPESGFDDADWHAALPTRRHPVPEYVPDVRAGSSAPLQLTPWKIGAIRIAVLLAESGPVSRATFKHIGIDIRRWIAQGWLRPGVDGFVAGPKMPDFRVMHPKNWEDIRSDFARWAPPGRQLPMSEAGAEG